jgi:7-carboxy-7-deazaguanine synthase
MTNDKDERTVRVSEIFYSLEGEGPFTGMPTVFVRFFGCNFTCAGFSNPDRTEVLLTGTQDLKKFKPTVGCDSIYAWHPSYKDTTTVYTVPELMAAIMKVCPEQTAINPRSGTTPILSFTGGEPTLHQAAIAELLDLEGMQVFDKVLIETNAALDLRNSFVTALRDWTINRQGRTLIWACSPKLSNSGELQAKAIRPQVISAQRRINSMNYLKFVSDGSLESFAEIGTVIEIYNSWFKEQGENPIDPHSIFIMPVGASLEQQEMIQRGVADACLQHGYNFCARVHCWVYRNEVGT